MQQLFFSLLFAFSLFAPAISQSQTPDSIALSIAGEARASYVQGEFSTAAKQYEKACSIFRLRKDSYQ